MPDLYAVDTTIKQLLGGSQVESTITMQVFSGLPLTISFLQAFSIDFETNILPEYNALQCTGVENRSIVYQARGALTPMLETNIVGNGQYPSQPENYMPPEFAYWLRFYVGTTYNALGGGENTARPIKRGGLFVAGASDANLTNAQYEPQLQFTANVAAFVAALETGFTTDGSVCAGAVLAEDATPGVGWRIAPITEGIVRRVTRLRSRMA